MMSHAGYGNALPRLLGVDWGERRVGIAISGGEGNRNALPLCIVPAGEACAAIARLVQEERAAGVVVGVPVSLSGTEAGQAARARDFMELLAREISVPVYAEDERYSSQQANALNSMRAGREQDRRKRGARKDAPSDDVAAQIILQSYLDKLAGRK